VQYLQVLRECDTTMLKVIVCAALVIGGIMLYSMIDTSTVYGCSEKDLPPDVAQLCKKLRRV